MHRPVRREDREISVENAEALLINGIHGVLATTGSDGQPYALPLNYVYHDRRIYFHCAVEGMKLDNIKVNPAVSFCVVGETQVLPGKFATRYESAVVFGVAAEVDEEEKRMALFKILEKYSPDFIEGGTKYINGSFDKVAVVRVDVQHLTGKARR